jgi:hypothetical protein
MGVFDKEKRQEKRLAKARGKAQAAYQQQLQSWKGALTKAEELLETARVFSGTPAAEAEVPLVAKKDERVFLHITGAGLVEPRRLPGQWKGGHSGVSFRIAKGVHWRVGGTRGTYEQAAEALSTIDQGDVVITDKRVVFLGGKQTREWAFAKLMGVQHDERVGETYMQVSNRQKVSGIGYGAAAAQDVMFRLSLALAHHNDTVEKMVADLEDDVRTLRAERPRDPSLELPPPAA